MDDHSFEHSGGASWFEPGTSFDLDQAHPALGAGLKSRLEAERWDVYAEKRSRIEDGGIGVQFDSFSVHRKRDPHLSNTFHCLLNLKLLRE
jgi:hypothetical protein